MERTDAELVAESLDGSRGAFRQIVQRYQTLVCSIAYSATGNLSRSEDVAQETFITAWTRLASLREPDKLRGWLCGIVRKRIYRSAREDSREPVRHAVPVEHAHDMPALDATPSEQAVSREEEAILWRSLENIPELYREPLILFYREHQSVGQVAAALELSEDAVKQRLSRGRKFLQEEVQSFVESTLRRTAPGQAFSGAVLTMLPVAAGPAAATMGAGLGANTTAAKSGLLAGLLVPLAPFLGIAAGVAAHWLIIRDTTADRSLRAKRIAQVIVAWTLYLGLAVSGEWTVLGLGGHFAWDNRVRFAAVVGFWWLFITATLTLQVVMLRRIQARREARERAGEHVRAVMPPMRPGTLAAVVAGGHLAMFSWLITLAWRNGDRVGVAIATGAMLGLGAWALLQWRGMTGAALARAAGGHVAVMGVIILLILNLRTDVWVASGYGVTVAEAHTVLPTWIVPVLTLALVCWTMLLVAVTKPNRRLD